MEHTIRSYANQPLVRTQWRGVAEWSTPSGLTQINRMCVHSGGALPNGAHHPVLRKSTACAYTVAGRCRMEHTIRSYANQPLVRTQWRGVAEWSTPSGLTQINRMCVHSGGALPRVSSTAVGLTQINRLCVHSGGALPNGAHHPVLRKSTACAYTVAGRCRE
jgi:hypothetical protein